MANSLAYNGLDLAGSSYGVTVNRGFGMPYMSQPKFHQQDIPQAFGGVTRGGRGGALVIPVPVIIEGTSFANLLSKIDELNHVMAPEDGDKSIKFDWMTDRYWLGRLQDQIQAPIIGQRSISTTFNFICADPNAYASTEVATSPATDLETSDPLTVNEPATGTVLGNVEAYPVYLFRNTSGSALTSVTLTNTTRSEAIKVNYALPDDEWLRIDSANELIEESSDNSTFNLIMLRRDDTLKTFPLLSPRVQNVFTVAGFGTSSDSGTLIITYRPRYRG